MLTESLIKPYILVLILSYISITPLVTIPIYIARHSWASIAHSQNIPVSVISEGMGHDSEATTQIYLASLDMSAVNKANSQVIAALDKC